MLKSCKYCGKIHDERYVCNAKPRKKYDTEKSEIDKFRSTRKWTNKSLMIRERDLNLCQICLRNLYNTENMYNHKDLQVHHIVPISDDWNKRLDDSNLITLCYYHHKLAENGKVDARLLKDIVKEQEKKSPPLI